MRACKDFVESPCHWGSGDVAIFQKGGGGGPEPLLPSPLDPRMGAVRSTAFEHKSTMFQFIRTFSCV